MQMVFALSVFICMAAARPESASRMSKALHCSSHLGLKNPGHGDVEKAKLAQASCLFSIVTDLLASLAGCTKS
jgi:hypothetical protein